MSHASLEERVAALERQVSTLLANHHGSRSSKNWRRTRGAFTGDDLMKQVFEEGRKIRDAERKSPQPRKAESASPVHDPSGHRPPFCFFTDERDKRNALLNSRLEAATDQVGCTIVSVEEILRGWLAVIYLLRDVRRQIPVYRRLGQLFSVLSEWEIMPFDDDAADRFAELRRQGIRIGTMDLKIVSIALARDALLLTANLRDFAVVPDLRCENWLVE